MPEASASEKRAMLVKDRCSGTISILCLHVNTIHVDTILLPLITPKPSYQSLAHGMTRSTRSRGRILRLRELIGKIIRVNR